MWATITKSIIVSLESGDMGHFSSEVRQLWKALMKTFKYEINSLKSAFTTNATTSMDTQSTPSKWELIFAKGLPWWRSGWESACQCRGHGFELWSGKIPHAVEQLGPWATTTEPARLEPVLRNKRGHNSERPAHRDEEWPPLAATRESPRTETKT